MDEWGVCYQKHEEAQTHFVVEKEAIFHRLTRKEEIEKYPLKKEIKKMED